MKEKKFKNNKLVIAIICCAVVLLLTMASAYSYFSAVARAIGDPNEVNVTTAQLGISYANGNGVNLTNTNLAEDWDIYIPIDITSTGTIDQHFYISWDTISVNTIAGYSVLDYQIALPADYFTDVRNDFTWTLYELASTFDDTSETTINNSISSGSVETTGYLYSTESDDIILSNETIGAGVTKHYVLKITFEYLTAGDSSNRGGNNLQDYQTNKEFQGNITVTIEKPEKYFVKVEGDSSDWQVSSEPNATGGYTLMAFIGDMNDSPNVIKTDNYWTNDNISSMYLEKKGYTDVNQMENNVAYDIIIPNYVDGKVITSMGDSLFKSVNDQNTIITNDDYALIKSVTIPSKIKTISDRVFVSNHNLKSVTFGENVESVGSMAFMNCGIQSLNLPSSLMLIDEAAFGGNANLSSITFNGNNLKVILFAAFMSSNLTSVTIPSSVKYIGEMAFTDNSNLETINLLGKQSLSELYTDSESRWYSENITTINCNGHVCG